MNFSGRPNSWCPVDQAQEHNIKDIKVTYRSEGPNIKWEYLKKLHPAIHVIRAVTEHIEKEFETLARGKKHTVPKKEIDVGKLQASYHTSGYHIQSSAGRTIRKKDKAQDLILKGILAVQNGRVLERWVHARTFERSKTERWGDDSESSGEGGVATSDSG